MDVLKCMVALANQGFAQPFVYVDAWLDRWVLRSMPVLLQVFLFVGSLTESTALWKPPVCIRITWFHVNKFGRVVYGQPFAHPLVRPSRFVLSSSNVSFSTEWPRFDRPCRRSSTFCTRAPFSFVVRCVRFQSRLRSFSFGSNVFLDSHLEHDRSRVDFSLHVSIAFGCGCKTNTCVHDQKHVFRHVSEGAVPRLTIDGVCSLGVGSGQMRRWAQTN